MHADRIIKQQMEQQLSGPSTASSSTARPATASSSTAGPSTATSSTAHPSTALAAALKAEASPEKDILPYTKERQKQFTKLFLDLLSTIFLGFIFVL